MSAEARGAVLLRVALVVVAALCLATDGAAQERPNVILMMADDVGYGDLSCYGSERHRTPVLDRMADEGVRLTSFYAGCTVCTPSRMALLTGAYPPRVGWRGGVMGYRIPQQNGLAGEALTMAEVFASAGYATGMCGKWHLGEAADMSPMAQGFDTAFWIKSSNNQTKKLWRDDELVADPFDNRLLSASFAHEAVRFIEAHRDEPFFLYLPWTAPHFPADAHPDWKGKSDNAAYGDVVEELDHRVGEILAALQRLELDDDTLVVFCSDNGPEKGQRKWNSGAPYRGLKWTSLEGGYRVPCIVRWPDTVPRGVESDAIIAAIDLLPTLARVAGIELPQDGRPKRDGVDVWDTLIGKADGPHPRTDFLYWHGWGTLQAIRVGRWKLYVDEVPEIAGSADGPALFDLADDPGERRDVAAEHPARVVEMLDLARERFADVVVDGIQLGGPALKDADPIKPGRWLREGR